MSNRSEEEDLRGRGPGDAEAGATGGPEGNAGGAEKPNRVRDAADRLSEGFGHIVAWATLAMVLLGAFNALARFLDRYTGWGLSSNAYVEMQWYLFGVVFLLGAAYTLARDRHVRVDVLFGRLSARRRALVDLAGTVLFLVPFCILMMLVSIPFVRNSWAVLEGSPDPGGLPRYPIKTIIPIAFLLLLVQGGVMLSRSWSTWRGRDEGPAASDEPGSDPRGGS